MADHIHEFKNLALRDIRLCRDKIQEFLDTTYVTAENAVDDLFRNINDTDVLKNLDEMNTLLKVWRKTGCCGKFNSKQHISSKFSA